jgi:hypothetical protein
MATSAYGDREILDSPINASSDSYPVTWLTKVVALVHPVADSLALYGLCGPGIRDCFGSGMATVPSTQTETLDSRNEETCSGTVQDARRLYSY